MYVLTKRNGRKNKFKKHLIKINQKYLLNDYNLI